MNLQQNEAPAPRRYHRRRPLIRRHFHTSSELSHNQITKHPPQRQHCGTRVVSQAALPSHVLLTQLVTLKRLFCHLISF
ncbi:unnamed protein product [Parnassius apollo]|uniref:(apollo) hypothetical protein n=1 Tax=Parnassius apollo TaxID=110799 RepID=A0A8S3X3H5_PARAO|nr:unnamed protein product [Parnassius apollo]